MIDSALNDGDIQDILSQEEDRRRKQKSCRNRIGKKVKKTYPFAIVVLIVWNIILSIKLTKVGLIENGGTGLSTPPGVYYVLVGNGTGYTLTYPLPVAAGGSGLTSFENNTNSLLCSGITAEGSVQTLTSGTSGQILTSNGPGMLPTWQNNSGVQLPNGTSGQILTYNGPGMLPTWQNNSGVQLPNGTSGQILTSNGPGILPTWQNNSGVQLPNGTSGQILTYNGPGMLPTWQNNSGVQLPNGTSGQILTSNGPGMLPTWQNNSGVQLYKSDNIPSLKVININPQPDQPTDLGLAITLTLKQLSVVTCTSWGLAGLANAAGAYYGLGMEFVLDGLIGTGMFSIEQPSGATFNNLWSSQSFQVSPGTHNITVTHTYCCGSAPLSVTYQFFSYQCTVFPAA